MFKWLKKIRQKQEGLTKEQEEFKKEQELFGSYLGMDWKEAKQDIHSHGFEFRPVRKNTDSKGSWCGTLDLRPNRVNVENDSQGHIAKILNRY
jgi:hypothetical protein